MYEAQIQSLYLAYYGRPADPSGLTYWADRLTVAGGDASTLVAAFANSPEATARFGEVLLTTRIDQIYQNLFGRVADTAGRDFYLGEIEAGRLTLGTVSLAVLNGAQNTDLVITDARRALANDFTTAMTGQENHYDGNLAAEAARLLVLSLVPATLGDQADLLSAALTLVTTASTDPQTLQALLGQATLSSLLQAPSASADPLALLQFINLSLSLADGDSQAITQFLGADSDLLQALLNAPESTTTQDVLDALQAGGLLAGGSELNPPDAPVITSNGGGGTASVSYLENATAVVTTLLAGVAPVNHAQVFNISGGADQALFNIDPDTGALNFLASPNFEGLGDNSYVVTVRVSDNIVPGIYDEQTLTVQVTNANEAPMAPASATVSVAENQTAVGTYAATDVDADDELTYSLSGDDAERFTINGATGAVSFINAPNFEVDPLSYSINVVATDAGGLFSTQAVTVSLTNVNEAPTAPASATIDVPENTTALIKYTAIDVDANDELTYSLTGDDADLFTINPANGAVSFTQAPDFETDPLSYSINVVATDAGGLLSTQAVTVSVTDVNEAPTAPASATVSVAENQTVVGTYAATDADADDVLTYTLTGDDAERFTVNGATGAVIFVNVPNFEVDPLSYGINVVATDAGGLFSTQAVTVNLTNVNEAPTAGAAATATVAENQTVVGTYAATDADADDELTYSLTGDDAESFSINGATGAVSFVNAPNFEVDPLSYSINVVATDAGGLFSTQAVTLNLTNVNETPTITSNGGSAAATVNIDPASQGLVTTVAASDPDLLDVVAFSIAGGADSGLFMINESTGELSFIEPPFFPPIGTDTYEVIVQATDLLGLFDQQQLTVNVSLIGIP